MQILEWLAFGRHALIAMIFRSPCRLAPIAAGQHFRGGQVPPQIG
jgi:hypothetical protein